MKIATYAASALLLAGVAFAQPTPPQQMKTPGPGGMNIEQRQRVERGAIRDMHAGVRSPRGGKWWKNSELVQKVGLSDSQVQEMEKIFQEYRLKLIDQHATLQKEELTLEPLIESDQPDEVKVAAQIDRVADARAALEKSNAMMFLGIRKVMTVDQWKTLQSISPPHPPTPHAPPAPPAPGSEGMMKRRAPGGDLL